MGRPNQAPGVPVCPPALACVFSRCPVSRGRRVEARLVVLVFVVRIILCTGEAEGATEAGGQALGVVVLQL